MEKPIVIAYHLTWTAYGFWLPNDPRGSMSHCIAADVIAELGTLHYGRKRVQPAGWVVREFRKRAEEVLKFPVQRLSINDMNAVAGAIAEAIRQHVYTCYACAIMPDHVHILIRKHKKQAEEMIEDFQSASRLRLRSCGNRAADHPVWEDRVGKSFSTIPATFAGQLRTLNRIR